MYNIKFPREVGNPKRKPVLNRKQFFEFINDNASICNLYTNVYNFTQFNPPFMYPKFDSAIIDRVYLDCDQKIKEKGEWVTLPAYENLIKLHEWCKENDIIHFPRCTGSAYDIIIATEPNAFIKNKKVCLANSQRWICKHLDIKTDPQVIGDIARIHRIDNTFNHKPTARRFCIPLDEEIIYLGEKKIFEIAKEQRFTKNKFGTKYWDITEFDSNTAQFKDDIPLEMLNIDESSFSNLTDNIPDCVKRLLGFKSLNWEQRRIVIVNLRDNCFLLDEAISILQTHLSSDKFIHCIRDEKQPHYLYKNEKYMFPHKEALIDHGVCDLYDGYCDEACYGCLLYGRKKD